MNFWQIYDFEESKTREIFTQLTQHYNVIQGNSFSLFWQLGELATEFSMYDWLIYFIEITCCLQFPAFLWQAAASWIAALWMSYFCCNQVFFSFLFSFLFLGTPVNRVPIMAKQTLDLFKLFKLVVDKGGLVEVSDKKLRHFFNCLECRCRIKASLSLFFY